MKLVLPAYIASIWLANWLVTRYGVVPVGLGLMAPAGVYAVGLTFTLRDLTQERYGAAWTLAAIGAGALLSAFLSPQLALASAGAFLASETADLLVYTPLRRRAWLGAVALSNTVGLVIDSALFLWLAGFGFGLLPGQVWGKAVMTVFAVVVLWVVRRVVFVGRGAHGTAGAV